MTRMRFLFGVTLAMALGLGGAVAGCSDDEAKGESAGENNSFEDADEHPDCDPLVPSACGYPFPSNYFLADDSSSTNPSGKVVQFGPTTLPQIMGREHVSPDTYRDLDGFSPGQAPMTYMPGATITGLPTQYTIEESLKADSSPTILMDAETGELVPHFTELDMSTKEEDEQALMIRPVIRLKDKTRYIVAFRHIKGQDGNELPPTEAFQSLRDKSATKHASIEARRERYESEIFAKLEAKGIARADLQMAWDYTTATRESNTRGLLKMRDEALALVGEDGPTYTVKSVEKLDGDKWLKARVILEMQVPSYMETPETGAAMVRDELGLPKQNGTMPYEVLVLIPNNLDAAQKPVGLVQNGHGLLGSKREGQGGYLAYLAYKHNYVAFSVDFAGFCETDVPTVSEALTTTPKLWRNITERQMQGHLNSLLAMRMMKGRVAKEGLKTDDGEVLIPPQLIKPELSFYRGDSQGGIMGTSYMAVTTDVTRGLLGEPGGPYNLLLNRSADYPVFELLLKGSYPNGLDRQIMLGIMQMHWDRAEPNGYMPYITKDMLPGTPKHDILMHVAIGDFQVTPLGAHIIARAAGAKNITPANRSIWGLEETAAPYEGSAIVEWGFGLPEAPSTNTPPKMPEDDDPHDKVRVLEEAMDQTDTFFRTGVVQQYCDGACDCGEVLASTWWSGSDEAKQKRSCTSQLADNDSVALGEHAPGQRLLR